MIYLKKIVEKLKKKKNSDKVKINHYKCVNVHKSDRMILFFTFRLLFHDSFFCFFLFRENYKFVIFSGLLHKKLKIVQLLLLKRWLPNQSWRLTILLKILDGIIVVEVIGLFIIIPNRQLKNANKRMKKNQ